MPHDVFVSYPAEAKQTADAVTSALESGGIRVWIAPRDVVPGTDWSEAIVNAIQGARLMVLIFDQHANESQHIKRELERAVDANIPIIPMRIENVEPTKGMSYFISAPHWLDAMTPPLEQHLGPLVKTARQMLGMAPATQSEPSSYATPVRPPSKWASPLILFGAIATILVVGAILMFIAVRRSRYTAVGFVRVSPPNQTSSVVAVANNATLRHHLDRYAEDLEKLDAQVAMTHGTGLPLADGDPNSPRALGYNDVSPDLASNLREQIYNAPLMSIVGSGQFGDRDDAFKSAGASPERIEAFRNQIIDLQSAAADVCAAVGEAAQIKALRELADRELPAKFRSAPPEFLDRRLAAACRRYAAAAKRSQIAAMQVLKEMRDVPPEVGQRFAAMKHLTGLDPLKTSTTELESLSQQQLQIARDAQQDSAEQRKNRDQHDRRRIRDIVAAIPEPQQPALTDTPAEVIDKARALRAAGQIDDAVAVFIVYGALFRGSDATAIDYAKTAVSLTRQREDLGFAGGMYVAQSQQGSEDYYAGLAVGNVLVVYDGKRVTTPAELQAAMKSGPTDGAVRLEILQQSEDGTWIKRTMTRPRNGPIEVILLPI